MVYEISLVVKAKIARELESDVHLEFTAAGGSYEEVRAGSQQFVSDYVTFHQVENVGKISIVYGDKDGLIVNTFESIRDLL